MNSSVRRIEALLIAGLVFGCAPLVAPHTYVLGGPPDSRPGGRSKTGLALVEVRPVVVPDFLDTRDIVIRTAAQEVAVDRDGQWAERLSVGIARALTVSLAKVLDTMEVTSTSPVKPATWQVVVDVDVFDLGQSGAGLFGAHWSIVRVQDRKEVDRQVIRLVTHPAAPGDEAAVVAMTQAIDRFAGDIAASLRAAR